MDVNETLETVPETVPETTEVLETVPETLEAIPETTEEYVDDVPLSTESMDSTVEPVAPLAEAVTVQDVYAVTDALIHVDLFGSFLVCGALMAFALLRRF